MAEAWYPDYRRYNESRIAANNAMIALLAGAHLASHTLAPMQGSTAFLPDVFPAVPHIRRFHLSVDAARAVLSDAEDHFGAAAVPYALAVHEDYVVGAVEWLEQLGLRQDPLPGMTLRPWNMHEILFHSTSSSAPSPAIEHFHLLREMRNCHIHAGGAPSQRLMDAIAALEAAGDADWTELTGRAPSDVVQGGRVRFVTGDVIVSFATSKRLARSGNDSLQLAVPRLRWAQLAATDFDESEAGSVKRPRNSDGWMRALFGYAAQNYHPLTLSRRELADGAVASGRWTRPLAALPEGLLDSE